MKNASLLLILAALFCFAKPAFAQSPGIQLVPDEVCFMEGGPLTFDLSANDMNNSGFPYMLLGSQWPCFRVDTAGVLELKPNPECPCREEPYTITYGVTNEDGVAVATSQAVITIKCSKPDCALVNLEEFTQSGGAGHNPAQSKCINTCENAKATYYLPYDNSKTYTWTVTGGVLLSGNTPAQIMVAWGNQGAGSITLVISSGQTVLQTITFCVTILEGPTASWTADDKTPCLGSLVHFTNTSVGGNTEFWDFGDGTTTSMPNPSHTFATPGIHTVCLYVTKDNYDVEGVALCCCSDTMCMDIVVDSLPGPNIYCLSTLCTGDASKYWTDAANCATYDWTVLDENGNPWPFSGDGTSMINVVWGNGPVGTVMLEVSGCDDPYCDDPVSITVPIIPATVLLGGPAVVCPNETVTYTVPKWVSADYVWTIVPSSAGVIVSGQGTNTVVVQWFSSGTLNLAYSSTFLGGLPDQNPLDCEGSGSLNVVVKPRFMINPVNPVCVNTTTNISASPSGNYTWTISPAETITSGQGSSNISVNWTTPGPHIVTAVPFNAATFCNPQATTVVQVIEVPKPDSIVGPKQVCLNQPYTYVGYASQQGLSMNWSAVGGTVTPTVGNTVSVTWTNPTGPYYIILALKGTAAPFCLSDTIRCEIKAKKLLPLTTIVGLGTCPSGQGTYYSLPAQHPDAVYTWTIAPATLGSIVGGQGTSSVTVQWNNVTVNTTATLMVSVSLCGTTFTQSQNFTLHPLTPLTVTFSGVLCPGGTATLTASGGLPPYTWSTNATGNSITITSPGLYTVSGSDIYGCTATGSYTANATPGPTASISTGDPTTLCVSPPASAATVTLQAVNGPGYTFQWYCNVNGGGYTPAGTGPTLVHSNSTPPTNVVGTITYYVVVTGPNGCTATSNILPISHGTCIPSGGGGGCTPNPAASFAATVASQGNPNCNDVTFSITQNLATNISWNFGDPNSNAFAGLVTNPTHSYTTIGCRLVSVSALVPNAANNGFCLVGVTIPNVCIPIIAGFSSTIPDCNKKVTFTDQTTFRPGEGPSGPNAWSWNFGGTGTSSLQNPMHTFPAAGTYSVTLTVTNAAGCQSTKVLPVVIPPMVMPTIVISGISPYCVGEPIQFMGGGTGITSWLWSFGTTPPSTNTSQNPAQSYLAAGTYTVTLTGANAAGCTGTATVNITVVPAPVTGTISASATSICAGTSATLTAPVGSMWMWSTGATTQIITVTTAGTYTVVVKDANGCTTTPAPVTITVRPLPPAVISGNPIICDNGCTTLRAPQGAPAYTYDWQTGTGGPLSPPNTTFSLQVCTSGTPYPLGTYQVVVTDANGCTATSPDVTVVLAISPNFSITASPTPPCEGDPVTLTLAPVQANVVYSWSNGGTGSSTVVTQAGSYQAVGIDTMTGCSFAASIVVHPLPDLCIVPTGCYKVCNPDTICGPDGLAAYQWNLNGVPIAGPAGTNQCLIVTQMGTYSLTGTTSFGCTATSDSLILMVMPCDPVCDSISVLVDAAVTATGDERPCCFNIVVNNMKPNFFTGINISVVSGGTLPIGNVTAGSGWNIGGFVSGTSVTMEPSVGNTIPLGGGTCAQICLKPTAAIQEVLVEFLDANGETLCDTTLFLECEYCMSVVQDTIICDSTGHVNMTFCVHNANTNTWNANAVVLMPPPGVTVTPMSFSLPNIPPGGTYCSLPVTITLAPGVDPNNVCIGFTIHEQDVTTGLPPKECCMITQCFDLPDCCTNHATAMAVDTADGQCCWKITLNQPAGTALSVTTNIVPAGVPVGSGVIINGVLPPITPWNFTINSLESITWQLSSGGTLPAVISLPTVCFDVPYGSPVPQLLEVQWSSTDDVLCLDTLEFNCRPDTNCLAFTPLSLTCTGSLNTYTVLITNPFYPTLPVRPIPTHVALVDVTPPSAVVGTGIYSLGGGLLPGSTTAVQIQLNGVAGTVVCFGLNMYRNVEPNVFEECCVTEDTFCVTLRDCSVPPGQQAPITMYPNPTRGNFTLSFDDTGSPELGLVRVRDVVGQLIREEAVPTGSLKYDMQIPDLTSGLYFVEFIENQTRVWANKMSVVR